MIQVLTGNMFEFQAQTLVNTVNCVGIMGKGIALEFKKRFPAMFKDYVNRCDERRVKLGEPYLYKRLTPPWILNFPTKQHWRSVSRINDIVRGLEYLSQRYKEWEITSLAVPPLGCGQGGLQWKSIGPILYKYLSQLNIPVRLFAPYGTPSEELEPEFLLREYSRSMFEIGAIKPGWVALVEILNKVNEQPYHWPVGRVVFQKIAYVATKEKIPTGLQFERSSFGPFSKEFNSRVLSRLVNKGLVNERQSGSLIAINVGRGFKDARGKYRDVLRKWTPQIDRIADLFTRVKGAHKSELVATVMFVVDEWPTDIPDENGVLKAVMEWKLRRRPPIKEEEIRSTIRDLAALGWVDVKLSTNVCDSLR